MKKSGWKGPHFFTYLPFLFNKFCLSKNRGMPLCPLQMMSLVIRLTYKVLQLFVIDRMGSRWKF